MKKASILGCLALLALATALFAAPALSSSKGQQVTIKSLASQVRALSSQVKTLRRQVAAARATASAAQTAATSAQTTANTAQSTSQKLDGCLSRALPVTRYSDYVGSDASTIYNDYDPDVLGYVPNIGAGTFGFRNGLDLTNTGGSVSYYLAIVEPGCAGGFRMAERQPAVGR